MAAKILIISLSIFSLLIIGCKGPKETPDPQGLRVIQEKMGLMINKSELLFLQDSKHIIQPGIHWGLLMLCSVSMYQIMPVWILLYSVL